MEQNAFFSAQEKVRLAQLYRELLKLSGNILYPDDCKKLKTYLLEAARRNLIQRNVFGMNPILNDMETALIVASEIGLTRGAILGIMVHTCVRCGFCTPEDVEREFGIHQKTLAYWRMEGVGPAYTNFGRRVFYERAVLEEYIASGRVQTSESIK